MKRHNRLAAVVIIAIGLACVYYGIFCLRLGTMANPDCGFMPALAGFCMAVFGAGLFITNLGPDEKPQPFWKGKEWKGPVFSLILMILYAVTMERIGYILSTLLFMLGWQFLVVHEKWWKGTIISVLSTVGVYIIFVYLLRVPVPVGSLFR